MLGRVAAIWRYPVKSMLGEPLSTADVGARGVAGDRAYALVDAADGKVASAKNPRKWGVLLSCRARYLDDEGVAEITLPDGATVRTDDADVDAVLSTLVGRPAHLASSAPEGGALEEVWPTGIDGLAPEAVMAATNIGTEEDGARVSQFPIASAAPAGSFFDLSVVHLLSSATLAHLARLAPSATFDARRYRPNLLLDIDGDPRFAENEWIGRKLALGESLELSVTIPTMRCIMTTLAQEDLPRDRETLRTIAANNRVDIPGLGTWACAGAYGDVTSDGRVAVGDAISLS